MDFQEQSQSNDTTAFSNLLANRTTVFTLAIACGLAIANVYYNQPLLADISRSFHISVQQVGFIPTLTQVGYATGLLFLVPLGDRLERKQLIIKMFGLLSCTLVAVAISPNIIWLGVASFLLGFSSIVAHLILPFVAQITPPNQRGKVIGTLMSGLIISVLLARSVSGFVGKLMGWPGIYWISAGVMIVLALAIRQQLPENRSSSQMSYPELMQSLAHLTYEQPVLREAAFNIALIFCAFNVFWVTLVFLLESPVYNYDSQVAGLFGLVGLVGAGTSSLVGRLVDKWGARRVVGIALCCALSGFTILWLTGTHLMGLILGVIILELGMHSAYLSNQIRVYNLVPNAESRLNTVYMVINYSGGALGSLLGSYSWVIGQWNGVCALGLFLLSLAVILHFGGRKK
ncbi:MULTISPECIES: MFS transporter [unclassified Tolypothrix]|uniref:MFS transporter n=1 Tax=unclassified Tolypothrix TaxID=2649714 RepID=UPI0005EAA816|nr:MULTISPECIES: MFS transporter [unclassified Tolypothrix]BAY91111.1 major facilitator superfamily MFS_1 [Microchaete diplosiphon NIES-3275]EKE99965.1 transporter, major facilitator family protein [Tolypothrix sp. PCC 7601]MBE9081442.1 MFS transporter [Tolypothrix sp. LEGE 11397]UYD25208.1 MFS transporter [Tolypothrix sp. PCC 7712]UYD32553.1 MFS transporter [Tolypothrix sp. PCC 7601]